jgi:hypothetical protein
MVKLWILAGVIFLILTLITAKITIGMTKKQTSQKMWLVWGLRTMYWQAVILISGSLTYVTMMLLKWGNILKF